MERGKSVAAVRESDDKGICMKGHRVAVITGDIRLGAFEPYHPHPPSNIREASHDDRLSLLQVPVTIIIYVASIAYGRV
jgi:hypothetical protein